jgi:hypothetical protein
MTRRPASSRRFLLEFVTLSTELEDVSVVDDPVDDRDVHLTLGEELALVGEVFVCHIPSAGALDRLLFATLDRTGIFSGLLDAACAI